MNNESKKRLYTIEDLENLLEYIPYEIWLKDKDGKYVYINQKGADKLGLNKDDIIGKTDMELRPKEYWEKCKSTDEEVMREQKPLFYEDEFEEGKEVYYKVFKFPIKDTENNFKLNGGMANEVTYNKHVYKKIEDLFDKVNESENKNKEYLKSLSVVLTDLNKMVKSTSIDLLLFDEAKEILSVYASSDSKSIFIDSLNLSLDFKMFSKIYNKNLKIDVYDKLNYIFKEKYNTEVKINDKSILKIIPIEIDNELIGIMYIYYEDNGEFVNLYDSSICDVARRINNFFTNIKLQDELKEKLYKSEEKFNKLESEIKTLEEAIDTEMVKVNFLENMSHEFKTPINIILMITKLLLSKIKNDNFDFDREKIISYLNISKQNSYRILRLVNNILDSTTFDNNCNKIEMDNYNIISIIEDVVLYSAEYIKNTGKSIVFDTEEEEVILLCNPNFIERIILNLISNSIKFTGSDGEIEIDIKVNHEEGRLYVYLRNNGKSIPKGEEQLIFSKFVQVENHIRRENEGSGIGLYLVKCLVELHNGKIWVNTEVKSGVEFIFYIPIKKSDNEDDIKIYSLEEHSMIDKCNIEFSDIYIK